MLGEKEIAAPPNDIEGTPRPSPQGSDPDMGAFENTLGSPVGTGSHLSGIAQKNSTCWVYPNPLRGLATFSYSVSHSSYVLLEIYTLQGQLVESVVSEYQPAGNYRVQWDASALASGAYLFRLERGGESPSTGKLLIIK